MAQIDEDYFFKPSTDKMKTSIIYQNNKKTKSNKTNTPETNKIKQKLEVRKVNLQQSWTFTLNLFGQPWALADQPADDKGTKQK